MKAGASRDRRVAAGTDGQLLCHTVGASSLNIGSVARRRARVPSKLFLALVLRIPP
jgi:hypothetical protein